MDNNTLKYIGFYDLLDSEYERNGSLAAINKMNYITKSITKLGKKVQIISPSWYINPKANFTKIKNVKIDKATSLVQAPSFPTKNRYTGYIKNIFSRVWLFLYLIKNIEKEEEIIVYHSLALIHPILWAKRLKKFKLILEVEEIYTDVANHKDKVKQLEFKFIDSAEKYIFSTELLNEKLNKKNKPYLICYGTYKVEEDRDVKFDDDKIHVVYAGTFDPRKGGASAAAAAAEYIDENYHIHIIGFGSKEEEQLLKDKIDEISTKTNCIVTYDGIYRDEEYIRFLQKCHIGLSTQIPNAEYNDTSFPSKVLSYMSNGLRVVSIRIKALEKAEISDLLYYYDKDCPKEIANAIKNINFSDKYNSREKIRTLDRKFTQDIKKLMEKINE